MLTCWEATLSHGRKYGSLLLAACLLTACNSLGGPERIVTVPEEVGLVKSRIQKIEPLAYTSGREQIAARNEIITSRMYVIDMQYTQYEAALLREGQVVDFGTKVASGMLTTAASLVGSLGTAHTLSETATLVNGLDSAYNDKILKSQIIQSVMASMRTARHDQAAILYANMYCPIEVYPIGSALSDIETYYRAGTFQTGLIRLSQTVSKAEVDAKANQDTNKPAPTVDGKAKLEANAKEAAVKANTKTPAETVAKTNSIAAACKVPDALRVASDRRLPDPIAKREADGASFAGRAPPSSAY